MAHAAGGEVFEFFAYDLNDGVFDCLGGGGFAEKIEEHLTGADGGEGIDDVFAGVFGGASADGFEHAGALRVEVAAGGDAHAALDHGAEIGDDIAEHVIGDDDIEPFGVFDEPHGGGVDVGIIAGDIGKILLADLVKGAFPEVKGVGQHVGFAAQRQFFGPIPFAGVFEGVAEATFDPAPGIDAFLDRDFVGGSFEHETTGSGVETLVVFADDDEIDVSGALVLERAEPLVVELDGSEIDVLFEFEP